MPKLPDKLSAFDWDVVGDRKRRLDVPLPNDAEGLHRLAHRFAGLSEALHAIARQPMPLRSKIIDASLEMRHLNKVLLEWSKAWDAERSDTLNKSAESGEHQEYRSGTGKAAEPVKLPRVVGERR